MKTRATPPALPDASAGGQSPSEGNGHLTPPQLAETGNGNAAAGSLRQTLALWVLHTYAFLLRDVSTYVGLESPQKRCGNTTVLAA